MANIKKKLDIFLEEQFQELKLEEIVSQYKFLDSKYSEKYWNINGEQQKFSKNEK